jgi:hypothetical protein
MLLHVGALWEKVRKLMKLQSLIQLLREFLTNLNRLTIHFETGRVSFWKTGDVTRAQAPED